MINMHELEKGDYVIADFAGQLQEAIVIGINLTEGQVHVDTDVQDFWYEPHHLYPIPLNDEELIKFQFTREQEPDGKVKYKKGAFRILIPAPGDFSKIDIWYRDDRRHHPNIHFMHQLQNHYLQMTKIHLTREVMV